MTTPGPLRGRDMAERSSRHAAACVVSGAGSRELRLIAGRTHLRLSGPRPVRLVTQDVWLRADFVQPVAGALCLPHEVRQRSGAIGNIRRSASHARNARAATPGDAVRHDALHARPNGAIPRARGADANRDLASESPFARARRSAWRRQEPEQIPRSSTAASLATYLCIRNGFVAGETWLHAISFKPESVLEPL